MYQVRLDFPNQLGSGIVISYGNSDCLIIGPATLHFEHYILVIVRVNAAREIDTNGHKMYTSLEDYMYYQNS